MSDDAFEGDLRLRPLTAVLGEIYCRNLTGRLSVQADGLPPLELDIEKAQASSPAGDPEAEVRRTAAQGEGHYSLQSGSSPGPRTSPLLKLVLAAASAIPAMEQVHAALGNLDAPILITDSGEHCLSTGASLSAQEGFLLSRVDGVGSTRELCQVSATGEEETLRALLGLTAAGLLQLGAAEEIAGSPAPARAPRDNPMARLQGFLKKTEAPARASATAATAREAAASTTQVATQAGPSKVSEATEKSSSHRAMLLDRLRASEAQNFYQLLEVEAETSQELIQKNYYSLARRYHPDRFHGSDVADLQPAMERLFARVNQAFYTLKDPERRQEYDRSLHKGDLDTRKMQQSASQDLGRENYRRALKLVAAGQYVKALPFLENAVRADQSKADYFETLGMVQSLNPRLKDEAERALKKACHLAPARPEGFLRLGLYYFKTHQLEKAAQALQTALGWDPTNALARMALGQVKAGGSSAVKDGTWLIRQLLQGQGGG